MAGLALGLACAGGGYLLARQWEAGRARRRAARGHVPAGVPHLENPPERFEQDTQPVDGEAALHLPPEMDLIQRQPIQG
jgi:hypothetical protein